MAWNLEEANIFFVVIRKAVLRIGRFLRSRAVGAGGRGMVPQNFCRSVNHIKPDGQISTTTLLLAPPDF